MITISFNKIYVNTVAFEGAEIIFSYGDKWYRMKWDNVPDRFKQLYVLYLRLQGIEVPSSLQDYIVSTLNVEDLQIELDLSLAEEMEKV